MDMFTTIQDTHFPVLVSSPGQQCTGPEALLQPRQDWWMYIFLPLPLLSEDQIGMSGKVILITPLVAITTMVSTSGKVVCKPSPVSALPSHPGLVCVGKPSAHMKTLVQYFQAHSFSKEVSYLVCSH